MLLVHEEHDPLEVYAGVYEVRRQREYVPTSRRSWRAVSRLMARTTDSSQRLAERLARLDLRRPRIDKARAERAVAAHLAALGIDPKPIRWIEDPSRMGDRHLSPGSTPWLYRFSRKHDPIDRGHLPVLREALARGGRRGRFDVLAAAMTDPALFHLGTPSAVYDTAPYRISFSALVSRHAITAAELAAHTDDPRVRQRLEAVAPFVTLLEAGVLEMNVRAKFVQLLARPNIEWERGQLHRWDGYPAASWPNGTTRLYFWRGVHMSQAAGARPYELAPRRIAGWTNAERRRVAIERLGGIEEFLKAGGATLVSQDDFGRLWRTSFMLDGEPYAAVEVVNSTAEPDGSFRHYFLRVPPTSRTAHQAVAWTFGYDSAREYLLAAES